MTALVIAWLLTMAADDSSWPQFRGPNNSGRAGSEFSLPADISPDRHVIWKTPLPPGHSSPVIAGTRIFVTAVKDKRLLTIALDRKSGAKLWEAEAPTKQLETIHRVGSHAQASPATDGQIVVSLFGSTGLHAYRLDGQPLWHIPLGPFNTDFGAASSPIIVEDRIILCQDHDSDSFLLALDKKTGKTLWRTDRSEFPRNYCTPVIWTVDGKKQIVVAATLRIVGYDFATGKELWTVRNFARAACSSPVVGDNGLLYVAGWAAGGDSGERIEVEPFAAASKYDTNKNGTLEEPELPATGPVKPRFTQFDRDKSGTITEAEYNYYRSLFQQCRNVLLAIKPGGTGDITKSHVVWEQTRYVPFCASPLAYQGLVFTVKDGGIIGCYDGATGKVHKQTRLAATKAYYSSPIAADGKVFLLNEEGKLTVLAAKPGCEVLASATFGEDTYATPAMVDGKMYLRTAGHLFCFGR